MKSQVRIKMVEPIGGYRVRLEFTDGATKEIDLGIYLHGPIFEPMRNDLEFFRAIRVDSELGTVVWPNGADIDPDVLYLGLQPAWMEKSEVTA
jgi:hypothetical protein